MPVTKEQSDAAFGLLYNELHAPTVFNKLASDYGIVPRNAAEQQELLVLGGKLRALYNIEQEKAAAAGSSVIKRAHSHVDKLLAEASGRSATAPAALAAEISQAATALAGMPKYAHAILTLQAAQAA